MRKAVIEHSQISSCWKLAWPASSPTRGVVENIDAELRRVQEMENQWRAETLVAARAAYDLAVTEFFAGIAKPLATGISLADASLSNALEPSG